MAEIVTLSIKDFRAIKEAEIKLNGITVVSGVNGCGKSTLSKFLYYTFRIANTYEELVAKDLSNRLSDVTGFMDILQREIFLLNRKSDSSEYRKARPSYRHKSISVEDKEHILLLLQNLQDEFLAGISKDEAKTKTTLKRIVNILQNILRLSEDDSDFPVLMYRLSKKVENAFSVANTILNSRPISLLQNELSEVFADSTLPKEFEICEYGDLIIGNKSKSVSIVHAVQNIAYIDTPMVIGVETFGPDYWDDLNDVLKRHSLGRNYDQSKSIDAIIRSEILQGESKFEEELYDEKFTFIRDNGAVYDLLECATGVKSFSMLQLMLRSGFLTSNTLLIIDEPEAHLHPQWIVEYARLIVLLNKEIGVNFLIASHNPDMVSAIKYISEKEGVDSSLNYYLAEQVDQEKDLYIYKDLGTDINPIFKSFFNNNPNHIVCTIDEFKNLVVEQ